MGHKLQMYENLRDMLERQVGEIERKHDLNKESLDNLYKLMMSLKVANKCIESKEMEEEMKKGGQSMGESMRGQSYAMYRESQMMRPPYMGYNAMESRDSYARESGESRDSYAYGQSNARRGRDGDGDGRYNESRESRESRDNFRDSQNRGGSYEQGGSNEYSRDTARKKMVQKLETLMDDTMSEHERRAIQECISKMK